ncbi:MAG: sigma-70 family RNA polymerase sigma factor [Planctomycetes bacterium]|nr:sigma-70 family RNA polymerase sigma factor [Planctomycetota bacterium]
MSEAGSERAGSITSALRDRRRGEPGATTRLYRLVERELRRRAAGHRARSASGRFELTELVDAVFVQLVRGARVEFADRAHFYAIAATVMRRIVTDWARRALAAKRGAHARHQPVDGLQAAAQEVTPDLVLDVDALVARLREHNPRCARVVELRFFAGLSFAEIAAALGISERTAAGDWEFARAWLYAQWSR